MEITRYRTGEPCARLSEIQSRSAGIQPELLSKVGEIIEGVRSGGDEALIHYTNVFDKVTLSPADLRVDAEFIRGMAAHADPKVVDAFCKAIDNVRKFHERQKESGWIMESDAGSRLGVRVLPVEAAGLYVPGGTAAYPSSVIMNAVPAQVAGVERIAVVTPPGTLEKIPVVAAVLHELGITEVYRVGGAQAIAALAFGTESIPRVDKIVGPGNIYVALAKKLVFGSVGIDSVAGPTEVIVLADESANPRFIAADMLAQAEHDESASAICITTSESLGREVAREVAVQLEQLERKSIASKSIEQYGAVFVVESIEQGCALANWIAPEHLELMTADNDYTVSLIKNAGAIFFGDWSSEPVGDYFAGPNHVLPTLATARFSSPLGVYDFVKRQSLINYTREALEMNSDAIASMADSEGLTAHRRAILVRREEIKREA